MAYSRDDQTGLLTFVQLSNHPNEDGLVSDILLHLQLLHAYACLICSLGKTHCKVNDLSPGILSFYLGSLHKIPVLLKWLASCLFHANINIINIDHKLSFCLQSKITLIMVEVLLCALIYNILL